MTSLLALEILLLAIAGIATVVSVVALLRAKAAEERADLALSLWRKPSACAKPATPGEKPKLNEPNDPDRP